MGEKMKKLMPLLMLVLIAMSSCSRSSGEVWEDTRTAGRYVGQGFRSLGGKHGDSRQVKSQSEFARGQGDDFIPLEDEGLYRQLSMGDLSALEEINADSAIPLSREAPGEESSDIPGVDGFTDAHSDSRYSNVFRRVHFPYNSNLIKGQENLTAVKDAAAFMKNNSDLYVFVEGHCDERGAAAYNLALGSRRSNAVRNLVIKEGVDMNRIFTISYGKERPLISGNDDRSWRENRRAQFRIFRRKGA